MRLSPSFVCFFFCFFFCCCFVFFFDPSVYGNSSLQAQLMIMTKKHDCEFSSSSCIIIFSSEEKDSQITYVVQILSFSFRDRHTNRLLDEGFFVLFLQQCFGLCKRRSAASEEAEREGEEEEIRRKRRRRPSRMDIRWSPLEDLAAFYRCRFELGGGSLYHLLEDPLSVDPSILGCNLFISAIAISSRPH
ncbi:unnamed protein product [Sphagnum compactum]